MKEPLLPYSQLVYDLEQQVPGIYNIPFVVCFDKSFYTKSQIETAIQITIANHPVFALRDDAGQPYYDYQLEETDKGIELRGYFNRILGDGQSFVLFTENFKRALCSQPLIPDPYDAFMRHYHSLCQSPRYAANRQWLAGEFGSITCPVRPGTDVPLQSVEAPQGGELFSNYGAYMRRLTAVAEAHHVTADAFWCLCTLLAIMDFESTDEAALTWAYDGRETEEEQAVFGSLHRDVPLKIHRSEDPEDLFRQIRNQMRSGIAHSSYPWTLTAPQSQIWDYAVNVLRQQPLPIIAHTCAIDLPSPSLAYALLDIEIAEEGLRFKYSASHYHQATIERFASRIRFYADWFFIAHTCAIPPLSLAHTCALSSRLEANSIANPDRRTNPVQSIEDLYRYAARFLTSMPWEGLDMGEDVSLFHRIDQSIGYFYYLFGPLQSDPVIAAWLTAYDTAWGKWLSLPASWNEDVCIRLLSSDPLFELDTGRYEDSSHWHCWNDFFSRRLSAPVIAQACAILSPCDGIVMHKPVKTATITNWLDLLADSPYRDDFASSDTFHIVLDMYNYHRFHAPVSGKVVDIRLIDGVHNAGGTIIWDAEQLRYRYEGLNNENFQMLEKRGVIVIDSPEWGRVAMVPVGVAQVSSVNWLPDLAVGSEIVAGQELGYFLCGGSDVVLFFEKRIRYTAAIGDLLRVGQPIATLYNNAHSCALKPYFDENGQWKRPVNPDKQHRTLHHDYQQPGTYMITLSTRDRKPLLGHLVWSDSEGLDAKVELSALGKQVEEQWQRLSSLHPEIEVQDYQLMPDHLHGILWVKQPLEKPLGQYIRGFKIGTTHLYSASMRYNPSASQPLCPSASQPLCPSASHSASMRYKPGYASLDAIQRQQVAAQSLWEANYNDRIAYSLTRLEVLQRYIHDNPYRLAQKRIHPDLFTLRRNVTIAGLTFSALGNRFLLEKPLKQVIQCSRSLTEQAIHSASMRYLHSAEEGYVHLSGAISKGERECCKRLREQGYPLVVLLKDGFPKPDDPHARFYKPGGVYFEACAKGQLLLLEPTDETWNLPFIAEAVFHKSPSAPPSSDRYRFLANNEIARLLCL